MRDKVLGYGWPFSPQESSNSNRKPKWFDWTANSADATVDTVVYFDAGIERGIEAPGRKIAWLLGSPAIAHWQHIMPFVKANLERITASYEVILTSDRTLCEAHAKIVYHPAGSNLPWIPEDRYAIYPKEKLCSMFASKKKMVEGHRFRHRVAEQYKDKLDLYGGACGSPRIGGRGVHPDKSAGLMPYRFHVAMENCQVPFYYTEKLTDCFATGTVPIYWGADCVDELFDPDGIITLDNQFDLETLSEARYDAMLPAIRNNFEIVKHLESADDQLYRTYIKTAIIVPVGVTLSYRLPKPASRSWATPEISIISPRPVRPSAAVGLPWAPWEPSAIANLPRPAAAMPEALMRQVTRQDKQTINTLNEVPREWVSIRDVTTTMHRPKSLHRDVPHGDWYPQLTKAFLLHLPGGFIGDNVVFDSTRYYAFGRWWLGRSWHRYAKTQTIRHIEAGISIAAWGGEAFQHFITDALPTLAGVIDLLETPACAHIKIVSHHDQSPTAQWFWRRLGLSRRIVQKPKSIAAGFVVHADQVMFFQCEPNLHDHALYPRHILRPIQSRLGVLDPVAQNRVLYLRRSPGGARSVANEDRLLSRVQQELAGSPLELEVFQNSGDLQTDMDRIKRAKIIFGPHGGAFANLVFAQPGTHVIEFLPIYRLYRQGQDVRSMYWGLSQAAGLDYWTVEPEHFDFEGPDMVVNAAEVAGIVRHLLRTDTSLS